MKIEITAVENGYAVRTSDTIKNNGVYVFRSIDVFKMLEFIGQVVLDKRVEVKEK